MKKTRKIERFALIHKNDHETNILVEEIFDQKIYYFETPGNTPVIIDCGAHIGVSVLYFKSIYPNSRIIAFEPNPVNYRLLTENVACNQLQGVNCLNIGISDFTGNALMYGNFQEDSGSLGNSISPSWGRRGNDETRMVSIEKLSTYIKGQHINYLKLDTEGCELKIIKEIEIQLNDIDNIFVEFHITKANWQDYHDAMKILQQRGFRPQILREEPLTSLLAYNDKWLNAHQPILVQAIFRNSYKI